MWLNELWIQRWKPFPFYYSDRFTFVEDLKQLQGGQLFYIGFLPIRLWPPASHHQHWWWELLSKMWWIINLKPAVSLVVQQVVTELIKLILVISKDQSLTISLMIWQQTSQNITGVAESLFSSFTLEGVQFPTGLLSEHVRNLQELGWCFACWALL